jgi:hypothetical protein
MLQKIVSSFLSTIFLDEVYIFGADETTVEVYSPSTGGTILSTRIVSDFQIVAVAIGIVQKTYICVIFTDIRSQTTTTTKPYLVTTTTETTRENVRTTTPTAETVSTSVNSEGQTEMIATVFGITLAIVLVMTLFVYTVCKRREKSIQ